MPIKHHFASLLAQTLAAAYLPPVSLGLAILDFSHEWNQAIGTLHA